MNVLVINCGSSSIKYQIFDVSNSSVLASGLLERIGEPGSRLTHSWLNAEGKYEEIFRSRKISGHHDGFELIVEVNAETGSSPDSKKLFGIGHRVVHGGEVFHEPTLIDDKVAETIREMVPLAPLHNPANLIGIEVALKRRPDVPQVAVFDTAYHQTIPPHAFLYALPFQMYTELHVRRYGFHGTSHHYIAKEAAAYLQRPLDSLNLIALHLGNGASATAIRAGKSIDTSMGMTPLEGLIMGTRCGDIDPALHFYLGRTSGISNEDLESLLNRESGLKGICGRNDMREIMRLAGEGDERAALALDMYSYRIKKYIGAYYAVLGRVDALVFTGGIGENAAIIRKRSCEGMEGFGIILDEQKNERRPDGPIEVQQDSGDVKVLVIPTNEELEIARQTVKTIMKAEDQPA